jgi:hypothetical protein
LLRYNVESKKELGNGFKASSEIRAYAGLLPTLELIIPIEILFFLNCFSAKK